MALTKRRSLLNLNHAISSAESAMKNVNYDVSVSQITGGLRDILTKMCEIVGADPAKVFPYRDEWYRGHSWTNEQEKEFREWFVANVHKIKKTPYSRYSIGSKQNRNKTCSYFLLSYGWLTKENENATAD